MVVVSVVGALEVDLVGCEIRRKVSSVSKKLGSTKVSLFEGRTSSTFGAADRLGITNGEEDGVVGLSSVQREEARSGGAKVSLSQDKGSSHSGKIMNVRRQGIRCIQRYARGPVKERQPSVSIAESYQRRELFKPLYDLYNHFKPSAPLL